MAQMWEAHRETYALKEPVEEIGCAEETIVWMVENPGLPNVKNRAPWIGSSHLAASFSAESSFSSCFFSGS
jgi:hypothetical protein